MRFGGIFSANGQLTANTSAFKSPAILGAQHNQMATGNLPFQMPMAEWGEGTKHVIHMPTSATHSYYTIGVVSQLIQEISSIS